MMKRKLKTFYLMISPWIVMFFFLNVFPMIYSFFLSLQGDAVLVGARLAASMNRTDDFPAVPYELPSCLSYRAEKRLAARERHPQNLRSPLFGTRRRALVRLRRPAVLWFLCGSWPAGCAHPLGKWPWSRGIRS